MPEPPAVSLVTRYVFESPWAVALVLLVMAAGLCWSGLREGLGRRVLVAASLATLATILIATGMLVHTAGEHAAAVTRALVDAVVQEDTVEASAYFADDAVLAIGSPNNPGFDRQFIEDRLLRLAEEYVIESNRISHLKSYTESSQRGTVHLACWTTVAHFPAPNTSQWVLTIERQADGEWKITHLTCVSINDRPPQSRELWP